METNPYNTMNTNISVVGKNKKILKPFTGSFNFKSINNKTKINILPKILPNIITNTNYEYKSSIMNSNIGSLSTNSIFNKKIKFLTLNNTNNINKNDFNKDYGMTKIKELKRITPRNYEDIKKNEKMEY